MVVVVMNMAVLQALLPWRTCWRKRVISSTSMMKRNTNEKVDESTYLSTVLSAEQVSELINVMLPVDDYDTLSGYVIGQLGQIPNEGEKPIVEMDNLVFKVEEIEDKTISRIKVCKA